MADLLNSLLQQRPTHQPQNNPQMQMIMQLCKGRNPKDVFFEECQKRGVDPQRILNQLGIK